MALLVNEIRRLHHRRRDMVVACPGGPLRTALEETGIARRVTIVDDPSELHGLEAGGPRPRRSAARPRPGGRPRTSTATRRSALLAEATLVIEARHADPTLTLADVAREVATSCRQLQRVFAEQAGGTFRDELAAIRLQHAAVLVQTTDLPVAEVGRRTGYGQASHFAKMFRLHHGVRPTALRHANVGAPGPLRHRSPGRRPGR
jgi:AraC-like DNA-binding protein